jgi:hypothetical protein
MTGMRLWIGAQSAFGSVVRIVKVSSPGSSFDASFVRHHSHRPANANGALFPRRDEAGLLARREFERTCAATHGGRV